MIMRIVFRHGHHMDVPLISYEVGKDLTGELTKISYRYGDAAPVRLSYVRLDDVVAVLAIDEPADEPADESTPPEGDAP